MPANLVVRIAGESEENRVFREQLNKKLHVLTKGLETCKRFVGVKALGKRQLYKSYYIANVIARNKRYARAISKQTPCFLNQFPRCTKAH